MTAFDAVQAAHQALRRAVPAARRKAHGELGPLASAFRDAMALYDQMKAKGSTLADFTAGLKTMFKDLWPKGECSCPRCRWTCQHCEDTGAIFEKRPARIYGGQMVNVVVPCSCEKGRLFRPKPVMGPDDFTAAGRSKSMGRVGR